MTIEQLSKLSDEELRVKCAELCGWKPETRKMYAGEANVNGWGLNKHLSLGHRDRKFTTSPTSFPNYPADLNAMHEAEKTLQHVPTARADQRVIYSDALFQLLSQSLGRVALNFDMLHATARQRCIAFIFTMQQS